MAISETCDKLTHTIAEEALLGGMAFPVTTSCIQT